MKRENSLSKEKKSHRHIECNLGLQFLNSRYK